MPPYYYDLLGIRTSSKITDVNTTPVGVHGVFKIRLDDQVDTLAVTGYCNFECGLSLELSRANGAYFPKYWLRNGMISEDTVEGGYQQYDLENEDHPQIVAGIWRGIRAVGQKP